MKQALFYAIRKAYGHPIVAVTTQKPGIYGPGRWYGRYVLNNTVTHGNAGDLRGNFKTVEDAEKCLEAIKEIDARFDRKEKRLSRLMSANWRNRESAIRNVCDAW